MDFDVRKMEVDDIEGAARVHGLAFARQHDSFSWIECNFRAYPRMQCFVAEAAGRVVGYIYWTQKSGFRSEAVLELEQLAVDPDCHRQGIGRQLIVRSLPQVRVQLRERGARVKHVMVTTRADNHAAQELYRRTLGAEVEMILRDVYSADEVLMIARNLPDEV